MSNRPSYREILTHFFNNAGSDFFNPETLAYQVQNPRYPIAAIKSFCHAIEKLGFDIDTSRAALLEPSPRHCVRCHEDYNPLDNHRSACRIMHDQHPREEEWENDHGSHRYTYRCCGYKTFTMLVPHEACCVGAHTTNAGEVEYNGVNVRTCDETGCAIADQEEEGITGKRRDPDSVGDMEELPPTKKARH